MFRAYYDQWSEELTQHNDEVTTDGADSLRVGESRKTISNAVFVTPVVCCRVMVVLWALVEMRRYEIWYGRRAVSAKEP